MKQLSLISLIGLVCCQILSAERLHLYIGNGSSDGISKALLDTDTGVISEPQITSPAESPSFMVFSKGKKFCYSTTRSKRSDGKSKLGGVSSYLRTEEGTLIFLQSHLNEGSGACHVSLDRTGTCLFSANYGAGKVSSYKVRVDGTLSPAVSVIEHKGKGPHPNRQKSPHAHSVYASTDNKFVYAADLGTDSIEVYSLEEKTAELKSVATVACTPGSGPRHMCFSHDGSFLYVLNELKHSITIFKCDTTNGSLTMGKTISLLKDGVKGISSSEIRLSDDGRFIYAANRDLKNEGRDFISVLSVDGSGSLKSVQNVQVGVWIPRHFDITPDGKLLVVAGQKSNAVVTFHRDPATGMLKPTGKSLEVKLPMWIGFVRP
jgi:6-phosphogluconolactonase